MPVTNAVFISTPDTSGRNLARRFHAASATSLPLTRDLRLRRTGSRLAQRGSTASLVPRALSLPRRAPPPLWETSRAATQLFPGRRSERRLPEVCQFKRKARDLLWSHMTPGQSPRRCAPRDDNEERLASPTNH